MLCVNAGMLGYLSCLVGNILANFYFDKLWFSSNGGLEILRFAVCIDPLMLRLAVYIYLFEPQFSNRCLND